MFNQHQRARQSEDGVIKVGSVYAIITSLEQIHLQMFMKEI